MITEAVINMRRPNHYVLQPLYLFPSSGNLFLLSVKTRAIAHVDGNMGWIKNILLEEGHRLAFFICEWNVPQ